MQQGLWHDYETMRQAAQFDPEYAAYLTTMKAYHHIPSDYVTWKDWQDHNAKRK